MPPTFVFGSPGMFIEQNPQTKASLASRLSQVSPSELLWLCYHNQKWWWSTICCIVPLRSQAIHLAKNHSGKCIHITEFLKGESCSDLWYLYCIISTGFGTREKIKPNTFSKGKNVILWSIQKSEEGKEKERNCCCCYMHIFGKMTCILLFLLTHRL